MRVTVLTIVLLAAFVVAGCAGSTLKAQKDNAGSIMSQGLPGDYRENPAGYGHPLRGPAFVLYPVGVALDYVIIRPFYLLGSLAPEWFGLTVDDAQNYQAHLPELAIPRDASRQFQ